MEWKSDGTVLSGIGKNVKFSNGSIPNIKSKIPHSFSISIPIHFQTHLIISLFSPSLHSNSFPFPFQSNKFCFYWGCPFLSHSTTFPFPFYFSWTFFFVKGPFQFYSISPKFYFNFIFHFFSTPIPFHFSIWILFNIFHTISRIFWINIAQMEFPSQSTR